MPSDATWETLEKLVGTWSTEMTHPAMEGVVVHGSMLAEWLEGKRFLIQRARTDHADFPDSVSILGSTEQDRVEPGAGRAGPASEPRLTMHYFDSRGVFRVYEAALEPNVWRLWRMAPGFSQRFTGTFADGGNSIIGLWQVNEDGEHWVDDVRITYRRSPRP